MARPEAHYEVHPLEGAGHQGTDVGEGRDTGLMAVEMDYGNFHTGSYDFTNMGFSSSVHVGAWIVSCFLLLFFSLFLFFPSLPTYYMVLFPVWFLSGVILGVHFQASWVSWWAAGLVYSAFLFVKRFRASNWISNRSIETICFSLFLIFLFHISTSLS